MKANSITLRRIGPKHYATLDGNYHVRFASVWGCPESWIVTDHRFRRDVDVREHVDRFRTLAEARKLLQGYGETVTVVEVDQFCPVRNIDECFTLADFQDGKQPIGDTFYSRSRIRVVKGDETPRWATTWYRAGEDGRLSLYRYSWDSSG